ncbi:MAG TPA: hypothetical protein P5121_28170 [Caldilineaceae bacterium]|nr:hypothetical protein [Caldilineaceae bacterium]
MIAVSLSTFAAGAAFAGQEKVTVCHKPGTAEEATLEIAAPAEAAHPGHGDDSGPCRESQSTGCDALNALQADPQYDSAFYTYIASNLEFYPGEMLHVDATITIHDVVDNLNYLNVGVYSSAAGFLVNDYVEGLPGEQITASADYTVVAGDGADQVYIDLIAFEGFTLDAVNFSCTPS